MADLSNQIEQLRQLLCALTVLVAAFSFGCERRSADHIYGQYRIDKAAHLEEAGVTDLRPQVRASVTKLASALANSVIYEFRKNDCGRIIHGQKTPFPCEFIRVEKKNVVVFRSQDDRGNTRYLRVTPRGSGVTLDTGERDLPLKRIAVE
jgi:hypothetical protein